MNSIIPEKFAERCSRFATEYKLGQRAKYLIPLGVVGIWGADTTLEVKRAPKQDKQNVLINNLVIGAAMIVGGVLGYKGFEKFPGKEQVIKRFAGIAKSLVNLLPELISKPLKKFPVKEFLHTLSIPVCSGIFGGLAGEAAQRKYPIKYDKPKEITEKASSFLNKNFNVAEHLGDIANYGVMDTVHPSYSAMVGYSVGKEKGIKNKIKRFVFEIISGVLIPASIVLPVACRLKEKMPQNPGRVGLITTGLGVGATFAGTAIASWFNQKVTDKLVEKAFREEINAKQRHLVRHYILTTDKEEKQKIEKKVKALKEFGDKVKNSGTSVSKIVASAEEKFKKPEEKAVHPASKDKPKKETIEPKKKPKKPEEKEEKTKPTKAKA